MVCWTQSNIFFSCTDISLVIGIDQDYSLDDEGSSLKCHWLDDEGTLLECYWLDDKRLTPASHHYARFVARWLEVLANYAG